MREKIFDILDDLGIIFTEDEKKPTNDIDLSAYLIDSYIRIMFALQMEKKLGISLREDALRIENFKSLNHFIESIS